MKEILEKIRAFDDMEEAWDVYGMDEVSEMIASRTDIDWNDFIEEAIQQSDDDILRILDCVDSAGENIFLTLVKKLIRVGSDDIFIHLFYRINDTWTAALSEDDLKFILSRSETIDSPSENLFRQIVIDCINRRLKDFTA